MLLSILSKRDEVTVIEPPAGYAGFGKRTGAFAIDSIVINIAAFVVVNLIAVLLSLGSASSLDIENAASITGLLVYWLYYAVLESSKQQATIGKRVLGIKVTDLRGNRVGFGLASIRWIGRLVSMVTIGIGFLMAAFTRRKQTLHDILAGCLVVNVESKPLSISPLPRP